MEPDGVATTIPSHPRSPMFVPLTSHSSTAIRPWTALVTSTSLTAMCRSPWSPTSSVGSSTIS